ncbi:DUF3592 domain-containing protein [Novosphingobium olei]|uniref:DUF3592 domain-containing protein n=1 Tax=Novosphingobium olei TaxID=2728851 RepID=A0A7Y0GB97_9SPHN|nr:DUF3592 domain-containing protein [Novosphingobium olei]NML96066.1 hypothetical protein [Novosphingobium olei]
MTALDLLTLAIAALMLGTCWCVWRAATLFARWRPAVATVMRGGYSDAERLDDLLSMGASLGTRRGWDWRDGEGKRWIKDEVAFEVENGRTCRAIVGRQVTRAWKPSSVFRIWYDPADPARVTAYGPWYWSLMAAMSLGFVAAIAVWGLDWARTGTPPPWLAALADTPSDPPQTLWERVDQAVSHK